MELIISYIQLGFTHVIPLGFDHILFIFCLFLSTTKFKQLLVYCTLFTVSHSLALGVAATNFISLNPRIVEPLIAFSIVYTALENILLDQSNRKRGLIIFGFGLLHGMGFASVLKENSLPKTDFYTALISFNLGVELGQIAVIVLSFLIIGKWFQQKSWYKTKMVYPLSAIIGSIALYWTIERILF